MKKYIIVSLDEKRFKFCEDLEDTKREVEKWLWEKHKYSKSAEEVFNKMKFSESEDMNDLNDWISCFEYLIDEKSEEEPGSFKVELNPRWPTGSKSTFARRMS